MKRISVVLACLLVTACSGPVEDVPRLSDADMADDVQALDALPSPDAEGGVNLPETGEDAERLEAQRQSQGGLLGLFKRNTVTGGATRVSLDQRGGGIDTSPDAMVGQQKREKIFGAPGIAVPDISPGMALPYGQIARVCGLPTRLLGKKTAQFPERRPKFTLYDSQPGQAGPHAFYLTGFGDGCARQFTASLAMFGSVEMHEQLRYGLPSEVQPYSSTDKAYEKLKSQVCRVPRKKPCGAKLNRLENDTVFLSIYEQFGSNARWSNLLLHDGRILSQDSKGG